MRSAAEIRRALSDVGSGGAALLDVQEDVLILSGGRGAYPGLSYSYPRDDEDLVAMLRRFAPLRAIAVDLTDEEAKAISACPRERRPRAAAALAEGSARRAAARLRKSRRTGSAKSVEQRVPARQEAWEALPRGALVRGTPVDGYWVIYMHLPGPPGRDRRMDWWGPNGRVIRNTHEMPWAHPVMRGDGILEAVGIPEGRAGAEVERLEAERKARS